MSSDTRKLYRSRQERMIAGVCGGLGEYFDIDPTLVRLLFVVATLFGGPAGPVAYLIFMIVVPNDPSTQTTSAVATTTEKTSAVETKDSE